MKRIFTALLTCILIVGTSSNIAAQNQNKEDQKKQLWEEMKAKRAAFFTERIGFTSSEAQAFWPVYYELQGRKGQLQFQMSSQFRNFGKKDFDFAATNEALINMKFQEAKLEKEYFMKFKTILCPEKLFKYYSAERDWANKLLKEMGR
jgi:hypothetical protein